MTRRPCGAVFWSDDTAQRDGAARLSRRDFLHFSTLWRPWRPLTWPGIYWWVRYRDELFLCEVWRVCFQPFWFYRADIQTESQMRTIAIQTRLPSAWVISDPVSRKQLWDRSSSRYLRWTRKCFHFCWVSSYNYLKEHGTIDCRPGSMIISFNFKMLLLFFQFFTIFHFFQFFKIYHFFHFFSKFFIISSFFQNCEMEFFLNTFFGKSASWFPRDYFLNFKF